MIVAVAGFLVSWFLKEIPLRASLRDEEDNESKDIEGKQVADGADAKLTDAKVSNSTSEQLVTQKDPAKTSESAPPV